MSPEPSMRFPGVAGPQKATLTLMTGRVDSVLAQVAAELEIRNVLARLAQFADSGQIDEYLHLFTEDAEWDMPDNARTGLPGAALRGRAAIAEGANQRRAAAEKTPETSQMHFVATTAVEVTDPEAEGTAISYFQFVVSDATESHVRVLGTYHDTMRNVGGEWKLARRMIVFG
jgi:3-phenylpropionate/cinnamic acid dioxygenase small subunit